MRADTAWDVAESAASRCSAHKTVGARADAATIDVSRKKWRRDGAELMITFFIVQPCDGARRCRGPQAEVKRHAITCTTLNDIVQSLLDEVTDYRHGAF